MTDKKTKFTGTQSYIATDDLQLAVNAAMTLQNRYLSKVSRVQARLY